MKKLSTISLILLFLVSTVFSCLTFAGNPDLQPVDNTVYEVEPNWPFGVKRVVKDNVNYSLLDIYLVFTGGTNGKTEVAEDSFGFARFATAVEDYKGAPNFLMLDLGNLTNGNNALYASHGTYGVELIKEVGYDFVLPGPADLAYGGAAFAKNVELSLDENNKSPFSAANITNGEGEQIVDKYQLYDFSGYKLALVGFSVPPVDGADSNLTVNTSISELVKLLSSIKEAGVNGIVVSTYAPAGTEESLFGAGGFVERVVPFVDTILIASEDATENSSRQVQNTNVSVIKAGFDSFGVSTIRLTDGVKTSATTSYVTLADITPPSLYYLKTDINVAELIATHFQEFEERFANVLATLPEPITIDRQGLLTGSREVGAFATFMHDVMKNATGADYSAFPADYVQFDELPAGALLISTADAMFKDKAPLATIDVTAADIYEILEKNADYLPQGSPKFLNVDIRIVYDQEAINASAAPVAPVAEPAAPADPAATTDPAAAPAATEPAAAPAATDPAAPAERKNKVIAIYLNDVPVARDDTSTVYKLAVPSSVVESVELAPFFEGMDTSYEPLVEAMKKALAQEYPPF